MRIQHNIMAMNAYRNYSNNTSALSKNLEKLSSGYKINRAGDDAAGLAISEKMRAQITGLETAQKNAKDGISLVQTAEGALTEVHDMLNRMVELADQSANGTYDDDVDRANLQKEFDALRSEIDRISKATNFNGINLLDGSQKVTDISAVGALTGPGVDGLDPTAATKGEFTVEISNPTATVADVTWAGTEVTESLATKNELPVNGALAQTGAAGQTFELSIEYTDADGATHTGAGAKKLTITTGADAATTFTAIKDAVANDADLKDLFEVTGDKDGVKLTSKAAGKSDAKVTGLAIDNKTGTGGVTLGGSKVAVQATYTSSTVANITGNAAASDTVQLGGKTYTAKATIDATTPDDIDLGSGMTAQQLLDAAIAKYNGDDTQDYTVALDGTTLTYTAKTAGAIAGAGPASAPGTTAITIAATGSATLGSVSAGVTGVDTVTTVSTNPSTVGKDAGFDLSGALTADDAITVNGKTYSYDAAATGANNGKNGKFSDLTGLKTALAADGVTADIATPANVTFKPASVTVTGGGLGNIVTGTTTYKNLADMTVDGKKISELFDVKVNNAAIDLTDAVTTFAAGDKIEFVAKTPGQLPDAVANAFDGITGANVTKANGKDEGGGAAATKATYDLKFTFANLAGGQTFELGGKTFELSLDGNVATGNTAINIGGFDLGTADGKLKAAQAIQTAVSGELGTTFDSNAPAAGDVTGNDFTLTLTAKTAGDSGNLGQVRVSDNPAAISATYTPGKVDGANAAGTFAQISYKTDLSKLSVGDKIKIGDTEIEIVADADVDRNSGKISLADAQNKDKLATAFETAGYNKGKIEFSADGKTMTITDAQQTGGKAADLAAGAGKVTFTSGSGVTTTGGLTLQIGDTSDIFNQITVDIAKMDCTSLGIDSDSINIDD